MTRTALVGLVCCSVAATASGRQDPPPVPREFRAAWVATVANIDWPSKPGLAAAVQRAELVKMLDGLKALNFNAVVLQVRPMCDAFYESDLEPWSEFLTGEAGRNPGYDPLAFAVQEAHARGLELHAWFNPYRARSPAAKGEPAATHLSVARPDLVKSYGKHQWLNPTHPEVQRHSLAVIADVVARYDIDGVHLDDYFYPYPELGEDKKELPFPDDDTWTRYLFRGGKLARDDWRRDAVNGFVERLYRQTKAAKPHVLVGISPFGIWKPGHPEGIAGFNQHDKLYADAKLWLNKGWVDYYTPQLYWPIAQKAQSYPKLLDWWRGENTEHRHLWPGNYSSKMAANAPGYSAQELANQIRVTRESGAGGNVHFSAKPVLKSGPLTDMLREVYAEPALVPESPWLKTPAPTAPTVSQSGNEVVIQGDSNVCQVTVQTLTNGKWTTQIVPVPKGPARSATVKLSVKPERVVVGAVGRSGRWVAAKP